MTETMTPPIVPIESGSQGGLAKAFVRRLPPFRQRRRHTLPVEQGISSAQEVGTKNPENTASNSSPSGAIGGGNQPSDASLSQVANQFTADSADQSVSLRNNVVKCELAASASQDAAGGVKQRADAGVGVQNERKITAISKEKLNAVRSVFTRLQRTTTRIGRSTTHPLLGPSDSQTVQPIRRANPAEPAVIGRSKTLFHFTKHNARQVNHPTTITNETPPAMHSHICEEPAMQLADNDLPVTTLGDRLNSTDTQDAKQGERESEEIERLRRDLSECRSQVAELQKRCQAQSRDLESSNSFLNATDKSSDTDVIRALQKLNAEVQQNTTYMADCLAEEFKFKNVTTNPTTEQTSAMQRASGTIGGVLAKSLGTKPQEHIPVLLQIAFQAYLASALAQTVSSWVVEPAYNRFITAIYHNLRGVEAQAVSGRWRSLARFHIIHSWVSHQEDLVKGIIAGFSDILLAAGCTAPQPEITTKVTSRFGQKIALLVELAVHLNKLFDEIISGDFEVLVVRPGEKFESKNMEDTDGDNAAQDASVMCATHLGLMKRMPVGTLWEKGRKQKMMVMKAKVVLESFLNVEDE